MKAADCKRVSGESLFVGEGNSLPFAQDLSQVRKPVLRLS